MPTTMAMVKKAGGGLLLTRLRPQLSCFSANNRSSDSAGIFRNA